MDFESCPECDTLNPPGVRECEQCKAVLPEVPDFAPPPPPLPETAEAPSEAEPEPESEFVEAVLVEPSDHPFEAPPETLARVSQLEAQIEATPGAHGPYLELAKLYTDGQRVDLAIRALERGLEHDPKSVYLRHRLNVLTGASSPTA